LPLAQALTIIFLPLLVDERGLLQGISFLLATTLDSFYKIRNHPASNALDALAAQELDKLTWKHDEGETEPQHRLL